MYYGELFEKFILKSGIREGCSQSQLHLTLRNPALGQNPMWGLSALTRPPYLATTKALGGWTPGAELPSPQQTQCTVRREKDAVKHLAPHPPCTALGRPSEDILLRGPGQGVSRVPLPRPPGCGSVLETLPSTLTQYSVLVQPLPHLVAPGCPGSINGRKLLGGTGSIHCNERILPLGRYIWLTQYHSVGKINHWWDQPPDSCLYWQ